MKSASLVFSLLILLSVAALAQNVPSMGKPGSLLVFPFYVSNFTRTSDTIFTIASDAKVGGTTAGTNTANLQAYFVSVAGSFYVPLTMQMDGSLVVKASDIDPGNKGYLIVMAVNQGKLNAAFKLNGHAFVRAVGGDLLPTDFKGSYPAWGFSALKDIAAVGNSIQLKFNGVDMDLLPTSLGTELHSPNDAVQAFVSAGLMGTSTAFTGAAQNGTGYIRKPASGGYAGLLGFSGFVSSPVFNLAMINNNNPRIFGGLLFSVPVGTTSKMILPLGGGVGVHFVGGSMMGTKAPYVLATSNTATLTLNF